MSLINRLLQDLEKRQASAPEVTKLASQVHAVSQRRRLSAWLIVLLLAAGVGFVALTRFNSDQVPSLPVRNNPIDLPPPPPEAQARVQAPAQVVAAATQPEAAIEAALLTPVFQLSDELSRLPSPQAERPAIRESAPVAAPRKNNSRPAPSVTPPTTPSAQPQQTKAQRPPKAPKPAKAQTSTPKQTALAEQSVPTQTPQPEPGAAQKQKEYAAAVIAPTGPAADRLEEITIPAQIAPIDKQMRDLTAFERAETEFRKGVALLRQGRVNDAVASFRGALEEDASHLAARQALIGLLIDLGRNLDAEQVLQRALDINPRQPRHAMLLARLELERGETSDAVRTLEAVRQYVGVDADYLAFYAAALQRAGRQEEAVQRYREALTQVPTNPVWMMGLGISLRALNRSGEALDAFQRAAQTKMLNRDLQKYVESQIDELRLSKR